LNTPESDVDEKGVCIAPLMYYLGFTHKFEQQILEVRKGHPVDSTIYGLQKFMALAADCNPNIVEMLHVEPEDILKMDRFGLKLREHKDAFLSKKAVHRFTGYALSQIKKMKSHRHWILNPPAKPPMREEFGLIGHAKITKQNMDAAMSAVTKKLQHWNFEDMSYIEASTRILIQNTIAELVAEMGLTNDDKFRAAARSIGFDENFLDLLARERAYKGAKDNWDQYQSWLKERNPARAAVEERCGYDGKNASHCMRLVYNCKEMMEGKGLLVKRTYDAPRLIALKRHGSEKYEDLVNEIEAVLVEIRDVLMPTTKLPEDADRVLLNRLCFDLVSEYTSIYG
jgi:predicted nucleotidyltransferase